MVTAIVALLYTLLGLLVYLWVFWGLFVLVMGLYRVHLKKKLTGIRFALAFPWIIIGYSVDILSNIFIATIFFWELPKELLVTTRLTRWKHTEKDTRQKRMSIYICVNLLDEFDPTGSHCWKPGDTNVLAESEAAANIVSGMSA
jgi:hypothetical protein